MTRRIAVIAFGSNLGDRAAAIEAGRAALDAHPHITVTRVSSLHESAALKPEGIDESAPAYLNAVALVETDLPANKLLDELMRIERENGRERHERWGDRTLDLDIIAIEGETVSTSDLVLPHPRAGERSFVLEPWLEIQPDARLGDLAVADLLASLTAEATR